MSIYIILGTPSTFDFHSFSEATSRSLELLVPLADIHDTVPCAQPIVRQVHQYIEAIQSGFVAAQYGFTAADDMISLAQMLDTSTQEQREEYIVGTLELADKAYSASQESYQTFRDIGATMAFLMEKYVDEVKSGHSGMMRGESGPGTLSSMQHIKSQVYILENFASHVRALARWWEWVKIEINPRPIVYAGMPPVSFDFNSLRQRSVVQRWMLLRNQFADYTNMGRRLQDMHSRVMSQRTSRSRGSRKQSKDSARIRTDIQQALRMIGDRQRSNHAPNVLHYGSPWNVPDSHPQTESPPGGCGCIVM